MADIASAASSQDDVSGELHNVAQLENAINELLETDLSESDLAAKCDTLLGLDLLEPCCEALSDLLSREKPYAPETAQKIEDSFHFLATTLRNCSCTTVQYLTIPSSLEVLSFGLLQGNRDVRISCIYAIGRLLRFNEAFFATFMMTEGDATLAQTIDGMSQQVDSEERQQWMSALFAWSGPLTKCLQAIGERRCLSSALAFAATAFTNCGLDVTRPVARGPVAWSALQVAQAIAKDASHSDQSAAARFVEHISPVIERFLPPTSPSPQASSKKESRPEIVQDEPSTSSPAKAIMATPEATPARGSYQSPREFDLPYDRRALPFELEFVSYMSPMLSKKKGRHGASAKKASASPVKMRASSPVQSTSPKKKANPQARKATKAASKKKKKSPTKKATTPKAKPAAKKTKAVGKKAKKAPAAKKAKQAKKKAPVANKAKKTPAAKKAKKPPVAKDQKVTAKPSAKKEKKKPQGKEDKDKKKTKAPPKQAPKKQTSPKPKPSAKAKKEVAKKPVTKKKVGAKKSPTKKKV